MLASCLQGWGTRHQLSKGFHVQSFHYFKHNFKILIHFCLLKFTFYITYSSFSYAQPDVPEIRKLGEEILPLLNFSVLWKEDNPLNGSHFAPFIFCTGHIIDRIERFSKRVEWRCVSPSVSVQTNKDLSSMICC